MMARSGKDPGIHDCGRSQRPAAHGREGKRGKQAHGADDDQGAGVPEQVREIELWRHRSGSAVRRRPVGIDLAAVEEIEQMAEES